MSARTVKVRVGMSMYFVRLIPNAGGHSARWAQDAVNREVWSLGTERDALTEVRRMIAAGLNDAERGIDR